MELEKGEQLTSNLDSNKTSFTEGPTTLVYFSRSLIAMFRKKKQQNKTQQVKFTNSNLMDRRGFFCIFGGLFDYLEKNN